MKYATASARARVLTLALCVVGLAIGTAHPTAHAHHSFSMYDSTKLLKLEGTVKEFQWTNPHVMMWLTKSADPAGEVWTIELPTSPGNLARMNWNKRSLKPGDHVVVELNPLRDGQHGGSFKKATFVETGEVLVASAPGAPGTPGGSPAVDGGADSPYAAVTSGPDASTAQTAVPSAAQGTQAPAAAKPTGGCACDVGQSGGSSSSALWALLGAAWLLSRRAVLSLRGRLAGRQRAGKNG